MSVLRKDLRAIDADGAASNAMVGIGETYLPAFVLALTSNQLACGLVSTVPMVIGAAVQLLSPYALRRIGSYRAWVVLCATIQAAAFVPLVAAALIGRMPLVLVFGTAAVYWATGLAGGPGWNAWVETLVPHRLRTRYFAWRTRLCQLGLLAGFVAGGVTLQAGTRAGHAVSVFALLFAGAAVSRLLSALSLARQSEPSPPRDSLGRLPFAQAVGFLTQGPSGRLLLYILGMQMAVQVSGPYFNPYMLAHLELSYTGYVVLICAAYVAKIVALPAAGHLVDRCGADRVLWTSGALIIPLPVLWLVSHRFHYLFGVQLFSGCVWAAYELAMLLLFFESIPRARRVAVLTVFNLGNAVAIFAGSMVGAVLLSGLGADGRGYGAVFVASTLARALSLALLVRMPVAAFQAAFSSSRPATTLASAPKLRLVLGGGPSQIPKPDAVTAAFTPASTSKQNAECGQDFPKARAA